MVLLIMAMKMVQAVQSKLISVKSLNFMIKIQLCLTRKIRVLVRVDLKVM